MAEGQETELKLAASPAMLAQLREHPLLAGKDTALTLVTRYFDTPDAILHRHGATLRLRDDGTKSEQTFKSTAGSDSSLRRGEWNAPATGEAPDPQTLPAAARKLLEPLLVDARLRPLATTRIERITRRLKFGTSTIEAAFDSGTVEAGRRSEPVCELELELVDGEAADLFALARQLPLGPELAWSTESKGERGHALALKLPFTAARAGEVALTPAMTVAEGFQVIAWNCLAQFLGNYREVLASGDPDAVHQSRVAIRRLRAAFSLFGDHVTDERSAAFRAEWKAAGDALSPARDIHVLVERIESAAQDAKDDTLDLLKHLRAQRKKATREAQTALSDPALQQLLIGFAEWLEHDLPSASEPLSEFAARTLARRRRKLVKQPALDKLSDETLHELRIQGKKLRYAAEFFDALYPDKKSAKERRAFAKALGKLQDCLGSVHDIAVAHDQREHLFAGKEPIAAAGLSAQLAELLDKHGPGRKRLIKSASKALDRVAEAPAWWKFPIIEQ
ncbi:CHAD domain-containing protein [Novosphingobium sp. PS1R-30]|uniref:CHAD domain-containing protein n=1 Tax=Novosphingobium anseongense TaxID=3133436 RepID=A0ABU8RY76_9SPHN|nr:MAG: CYTH and CHAD domain-containing protein [Novosphingobium sp.]